MCVVDVIVLVEFQLAQLADGNITRSHSVDFGMALILEVVVHPLEFLFLQGYEEGKIPVLVAGQQSLVGMCIELLFFMIGMCYSSMIYLPKYSRNWAGVIIRADAG